MFETRRLILRSEDVETDFDNFIKWQNDPEFMALMTIAPLTPTSREKCKDSFKSGQAGPLPGFAVCLKPHDWPHSMNLGKTYFAATGQCIGFVRLFHNNFNYKNRCTAIGLGFPDPAHRGQGFGREVLEWALDYIFVDLGLHRVEIECFGFNDVAYRLYKKLGFVEESRRRKAIWHGGKWHDIIGLAMLEEEYHELKKTQASKTQDA